MLDMQIDQEVKERSSLVDSSDDLKPAHAQNAANASVLRLSTDVTELVNWLSTGDLPQKLARHQNINAYLVTQLERAEDRKKQLEEDYRVANQLKHAQLKERDLEIMEMHAQIDQLRQQVTRKDSEISDLEETVKLEKIRAMEDVVRLEDIVRLQDALVRKEETSRASHDSSQMCSGCRTAQTDQGPLELITRSSQPGIAEHDIRVCSTTAIDTCSDLKPGAAHQCSLQDACSTSVTITRKRKRCAEDDSHERKHQRVQ
jgi:predicted RNase H-like nuclease (RuvC/YqgF family)